ncbi:MAG: hypothetical protein KQH83_01510 [Actinobacteria bacterium]|nr:hypothetical protein [Actinomycetota bacterium]
MSQAGIILHVGPGADADRHTLQQLGHDVVTCSGRGPAGCLLVEEGWCPVVDVADGVLLHLDLDDPYQRSVLRCYREELGDASPLWVVVPEGQDLRHAGLLDGLDVGVGRLEGAVRFSSQVAMAAAVRRELAAAGDPTRCSSRAPGRPGARLRGAAGTAV